MPGDEDVLYYEPGGSASAETEVKKSRFIGTVTRVASAAEAQEALRAEKEKNPGASHVVYAFIAGPPQSETAGLSDAGEPKGTAGRPVMEALKGNGLRNAMVTVTRYFGGTLLGTGGLVRAYADCAKKALEKVVRAAVRLEKRYVFTVPYDVFDGINRAFEEAGCSIYEKVFTENVKFSVTIPNSRAEHLIKTAQDIGRGRVIIGVNGGCDERNRS